MWLKRLLRPLIPDRIMARYRLHQHSRQVRVNVDVFVDSERERRRWLSATPDTYRVGLIGDIGTEPLDDVALFGTRPEGELAARAARATGAAAGVVGVTTPPQLLGRRRAEPAVAPIALAVRRSALAEVGGEPSDLVGLHRRLRDAGHRIAVVPAVEGDVDAARHDAIDQPVVEVLAAVPMHDVGGGSRAARITVELLRRGFRVFYVAVFGTDESVDLGLRFVHPQLEQYRLDEMDVANIAARVAVTGLVLVEVPHPALLDTVQRRRESGWRVVYDVIDRWDDPALGGDWYRPSIESRFVSAADVVSASSSDLASRVADGGREAVLIANAVDAGVFARPDSAVPDDFPDGDGPVLGYHGSLYGDWIDWAAIEEVATARRDARIILIGDASRAPSGLPDNVHLLGLKPQQRLPDYIARFDVGLIPFTVSETTHAVSPLKVYEYLACGVPVASPPLRALRGLDGVFTAERLIDAVATAISAEPPDRVATLRDHSWTARMGALLAAAGVPEPAAQGSRPAVVERAAVHYGRRERAI